jgi:hypothetical protein
MSTVTLTLIKSKYAPWGLLTEEENPRMLVWLTEESPEAQIDSMMLTYGDISRIQQSKSAGIIDASGIDEIDQLPSTSTIPPTISTPVPIQNEPKIAPPEVVMDVTQLMRQEAERAMALEKRIMESYPEVDKLLAKPAYGLKKELKRLAKGNTSISFFQRCRKNEQEGKNRKSVIAVLVEIIQAKINAVRADSRPGGYTNQTSLSSAYYDLIEEFEDEDNEEEKSR